MSTSQTATFPTERDLLVTTCSAVSRWTVSTGISKIYRSVHDSIATARWSNKALAIADGRVILLEDSSSNKRRYRLKTGEGHLCVLAYANNHQELLFSTSLQYAVLRYCIIEDRLLDWKCLHPSPPTTLTVSARSKYAISSSQTPPTVYLSLLDSARHIVFWPHASQAPITAAAFHPISEEHFLLGYADGTVSIHTASRIVLMQVSGSDGSIGHLKRAHRTTNEFSHSKRIHRRPVASHRKEGFDDATERVGSSNVGITAAAFMHGCKLRIITVAGDGKCRMIDFERGAQVLRTWSVDAPCTSLSLYSPTELIDGLNDPVPQHIIAIGRADGEVSLFDYLGLLQERRLVDNAKRKIIALEWVPHASAQSQVVHLPVLDGKGQHSINLGDWRYSPKTESRLEIVRSTPSPKQLSASRSVSRLRHREPAARKTGALPPSTPKSPNNFQAAVDKIWPQSPSSSAKRKTIHEATSQATQTPPNLLDFLRRTAHTRSPPVATVAPLQLPSKDEARSSRRSRRHSSEQRTTMQAHSDMYPARRHSIAGSGTLETVPVEHNNVRSSVRNRRDSAMPCSWVSETGSASSNEEAKAPAIHKPGPSVASNVELAACPAAPATLSNQALSVSASPRGRPQTLPASSASTVSLADLSDGWDTDAESSPVRRHQVEKQTHKDRYRRLRRMTIHDNLARFQLGSRGKSHDQSLSDRSPHHVGSATILAVKEKEPEAPSSLYSLRPTARHGRTSGEPVGRESSSPGSNASELLTFYTDHHHQPDQGTAGDKPLPRLPLSQETSSSEEQMCNCDCSETVREEMALVRAELASLRKALWVFGSRVEASGWRDVACGDVSRSPIASDVAFADFDGRWAKEEPRGRPRRRSFS